MVQYHSLVGVYERADINNSHGHRHELYDLKAYLQWSVPETRKIRREQISQPSMIFQLLHHRGGLT